MKKMVKKLMVVLLSVAMVLQTLSIVPDTGSDAEAAYNAPATDSVIGTFYNYGSRTVNNNSGLGLYCDWTTIDGGKVLDMTKNGINEGAYLHMTIKLDAIKNGQHVSDFKLGGLYFKLRSVDNNGENNFGWDHVTLNEGINQLDIPLYSSADRYANTAYSYTNKTGTMDWSKLNRLIVVSLEAKNYYGTDTEVSMTLSDVCITCPTDKRDTTGFENVRIAESSLGSEDKIAYTVNAVTDMGADNTGNNDATAAIQAAIDSVKSNGGVVFLPAGQYKVSGTLNVPRGVTLRGEWKNPDEGGLGKGTILKAYSGRGDENGTPFITFISSCIRDLSIWYPEQNAASPVAYPYTIYGSGHTSLYNVTLYNSYNGFKNNTCSSMLIRGMYGTVMHNGIWGAYAYDVPRTEKVSFDTKYWANSGFAGAPSGSSLAALNTYCENNLLGVLGGEQDWGYWYDIYVNHAKAACYLTAVLDDPGNKVNPGNDAIGKLKTENVQYGIYIHSTSYPGLEVSYSDISASVAGIYYGPKPANNEYFGNESGAVNAAYFNESTIIITKTNFSGSGYGYLGENNMGERAAANFNNCTFDGWTDAAIKLVTGTLVCSNGTFKKAGTAIKLEDNVVQAVLTGNSFKSGDAVYYNAEKTAVDMTSEKLVPDTPDYDYNFAPSYNPANNNIYNVEAYGAIAGVIDSTGAFQAALNAAGAAGGGTVYVPAGSYTLRGSLTVPSGVELRGSFDGAHYGNSTQNGSVLYVYANKDNENGPAFITLNPNAGVRGFTIVYPEQGITDNPALDEVVHTYPATIEMNRGSWARTCSINGCYTMIDAMKNVCDGFVLNDVTGCYMGYGLKLGHGTNGGYVQDFHSNYTSWPTSYLHAYKGTATLTDYTTQNSIWMLLGDFSNINFFSDFTILISEGMKLIKDPYTGKSSKDMLTWGTAFDATGDGIVGEPGADTVVTLLSSMGVYNQHDPGYNVYTKPGFNGTVNLFNADVWSPQSRLVNVAGGTVNMIQYLSWCCYNGVAHDGGTVNMYGSTFVGSQTGSNIGITYEAGSKGTIAGNANNSQNFNIVVKPGATEVDMLNNGLTIDKSTDVVVDFNTYAPGTYSDNNGVVTTGWKALTPLKLANGGTQNHAGIAAYNPDDLFMKVVLTLDKGNNTASDSSIFKSGTISLRQAWSKNDGSDDALCFTLNDGNFAVKSGEEITLYMPMEAAIANNPSFNWSGVKHVNITLNVAGYSGIKMTVSDVRIVDNSVTDYWKYELYKTVKAGPDVNTLNAGKYASYISLVNSAMALYNDESASMAELQAMIADVEAAREGVDFSGYLDRTDWVASAYDHNGIADYALHNKNDGWYSSGKYDNVPDMWFMVDLGKATVFDTIELTCTMSENYKADDYDIYVSLDGVNWGSPVYSVKDKIDEHYIGTQYARYVKIVKNSTNRWRIEEFNLKNVDDAEAPAVDTGISESNLLLNGRTYYENGELKLGWTNSGAAFNFTGTGATATISTTTTAELLKGYINVYVDGALVPTSTICIDKSTAASEYVLAEGLAYGSHTIEIRKRNEAGYGGNATLGISKISITGGYFNTKPEASNRKIEIVGDSITSGFGNLVFDGKGNYNSSNTEGTMTYAALTGRAFGAETSIVSRSGIRFVRIDPNNTAMGYYLQTSGLTGNKNPYNFDGGSDVVVINLGTNDNGARDANNNLVSDAYVQSEAEAFLQMVRGANPDAIIIWAYGLMGNGRSEAIKAAVNKVNDGKMFFLPLDQLDQKTEGSGVGAHPTIIADIDRSFDLVEFIAEKTGWDYNFDAQLATEILEAERLYDDEMLSQYTKASVDAFKDAIAHAKTVNAGVSAATAKAEWSKLEAARKGLMTKLQGGEVLDRTGWTAYASVMDYYIKNAIDGKIDTRWATNGQNPKDQWFMIDAGEVVDFDTVEMLLGTSTNDGPAAYEIQISNDGTNWQTILSGTGQAEQYYVGAQSARYVKVIQTGEKGNYWSIHEFNLKVCDVVEKYTVKYMVDGEVFSEDTVEYGKSPASLAASPSKSGLVFAGWYEEEMVFAGVIEKEASSVKPVSAAQITGQKTLYAGWIDYSLGSEGRLDRTGWTASSSTASGVKNAIDGNIGSRWTTLALQAPDQWLMIDAGKPQYFDYVELLLGSSANDQPAGYEIYVSLDGEDWGEPVASGTNKQEAYYVGLQYARYVKVVQTGNRGCYWSVHEFYLKNTTDYRAFDVTYMVDGEVYKVDTIEYGKTLEKLADSPKAAGLVFAGWYEEEAVFAGVIEMEASSVKPVSAAQITGDKTLYAGWIDYSINGAGRLDRTGWKVSGSQNTGLNNAIDGNLDSRWATLAVQVPGQWFMVDTGKAQPFDTVELLLASSTRDNPAGYEIYVSLDGENWGEPVASGTDKKEVYDIGLQYARYVKVVQTGNKGLYWSFHEIYLKCTVDPYFSVKYYDGDKLVSSEEYITGTKPNELYEALSADGKIFAGWYTERVDLSTASSVKNAASKAANLSAITGDTILYAGWIEIGGQGSEFELQGVQVKTVEPMGLRFVTEIGTGLIEKIEALSADNEPLTPESASDTGIGYGTVATVASLLNGSELVKDVNVSMVNKGMAVCPAVNFFAKTANGYQYTCVIKGIKAKSYETEIAARPYITYKDANGRENTYYYTEPDSNAGGGYKTSLYKAAKAVYSSGTDSTVKEWVKTNIIDVVER